MCEDEGLEPAGLGHQLQVEGKRTVSKFPLDGHEWSGRTGERDIELG